MDNRLIGKFIKEKLKEKNITQEQFAERLNKTASAISQKLNGEISFVLDELPLIAKIIGVSVNDLIRTGENKISEIEIAIKSGIEEVKKLESKGIQLDSYNSIQLAIKNEKIDILEYLIQKGWYKEGLHKDIEYLIFIIKNALIKLINHTYYSPDVSDKWVISPSRIELPSFEYIVDPYALSLKGLLKESLQENHKELVFVTVKQDLEIAKALPYNEKTSSGKVEKKLKNIFEAAAIEVDNLALYEMFENMDENYNDNYRKHNNRRINDLHLNCAIANKSYSITKKLLGKHLDHDQLRRVIESNDLEFFSKFVRDINNNPYMIGYWLLRAVELSNKVIVEYLWDKAEEKFTNQALDHVPDNDLDMIQFLLNKGCQFSYTASYGGAIVPLPGITKVIKTLLNDNIKKQ